MDDANCHFSVLQWHSRPRLCRAICTAGGGCATSACCRTSSSRRLTLDPLPPIGLLVLQLHSLVRQLLVGAAVELPHLGWQYNCHPNTELPPQHRWGRHSCLPGADKNVCPTNHSACMPCRPLGFDEVRVRPTAHAAFAAIITSFPAILATGCVPLGLLVQKLVGQAVPDIMGGRCQAQPDLRLGFASCFLTVFHPHYGGPDTSTRSVPSAWLSFAPLRVVRAKSRCWSTFSETYCVLPSAIRKWHPPG